MSGRGEGLAMSIQAKDDGVLPYLFELGENDTPFYGRTLDELREFAAPKIAAGESATFWGRYDYDSKGLVQGGKHPWRRIIPEAP
jgi:hypothetical protein